MGLSSLHSEETEARDSQVTCPRSPSQRVAGQDSLLVGLPVCSQILATSQRLFPLGAAPRPQASEVHGLPLAAEAPSFTLGAGPGWRHWVPLQPAAPTPPTPQLCPGWGDSLQPGSLGIGAPSWSPHPGRTHPLTAPRPGLFYVGKECSPWNYVICACNYLPTGGSQESRERTAPEPHQLGCLGQAHSHSDMVFLPTTLL